MNVYDEKIIEILLKGNFIVEEDGKKAAEFAKTHRSTATTYFLNENLLTRDLIGQAIAEYFGVPYADLNSHPAPREQAIKIPQETAKKYRAVLFSEDDNNVVVTTDSPKQEGLESALKGIFPKQKITIAFSLPEDVESNFSHYREELATRFVKIAKEQKKVAPEIIDEVLDDALVYKASDIHFEPQEKQVLLRFRIDGILKEVGVIQKEDYEAILNRIKVQAHLRIDEHFAAQDGAIRHITKENRVVDLRVSLTPTLDGEKVVMRVLSEYISNLTLADLGFLPRDQKIVLESSEKPFGMILVTGPTGSGKTTTLYAILKILNRPEVNITTIEDPVEYKNVGVNQIQVNPHTNITFAQGLRSIVRQDPDIILVGEIRDEETAEIAVNAALTGHLLLSTFHANDAPTAIPRLLDMGIEPFLLASTIEVIIAQRLARKICETCRYSLAVKQEEILQTFKRAKEYFPEPITTLYKGKGCKACGGSGYKGRVGIFEFIDVSPEMEELIQKNPSTKEIWDLARKQGAHSLFEDGLEKIKAGLTTLEEVLRVAAPPDTEHTEPKTPNGKI